MGYSHVLLAAKLKPQIQVQKGITVGDSSDKLETLQKNQ